MAQFFHDGAIIVSVDESNFRSDLTKNWSWQFNNAKLNKVFNAVAEEMKDDRYQRSESGDIEGFDPDSHMQMIPSYSKSIDTVSNSSIAS